MSGYVKPNRIIRWNYFSNTSTYGTYSRQSQWSTRS